MNTLILTTMKKGSRPYGLMIVGLLLSLGTLSAQSGPWERLDGPMGGGVTNIGETDEGLAIGTLRNGIHRSIADGASWFSSADSSFAGLPLLFEGEKIYAVRPVEDGIFVSTDLGDTWEQRGAGLYGTTLFMQRWNADTLYSITDEAVFASRDDGYTWLKINTQKLAGLTILRVSPEGTIVVARRDSIFRSSDQGGSWVATDVDPSGTESTVMDVLFLDNNRVLALTFNGLFLSSNRGASFSRSLLPGTILNRALGNPFYPNGDILLSERDAGRAYRVSADLATATPLTLPSGYLYNTAVSSSGALFAMYLDIGIWRSSDAKGAIWNQTGLGRLVTGRLKLLANDMYTLQADNAVYINPFPNTNFWKLLPNVGTPVRVIDAFPDGRIVVSDFGGHIYSIDPDAGTFIKHSATAVTDSRAEILTQLGTLIRTTNRSVTRSIDTGRTADEIRTTPFYGYAQYRDGTIFAYDRNKLYTSNDDGRTFKYLPTPVSNDTIYSIHFLWDGRLLVDGYLSSSLQAYIVSRDGTKGDFIELPCTSTRKDRITMIWKTIAYVCDSGIYVSYTANDDTPANPHLVWDRFADVPNPGSAWVDLASTGKQNAFYLSDDVGLYGIIWILAGVEGSQNGNRARTIDNLQADVDQNRLVIRLHSAGRTEGHVRMYDLQGKEVLSPTSVPLLSGPQTLTLGMLDGIASGMYLVTVETENDRLTAMVRVL